MTIEKIITVLIQGLPSTLILLITAFVFASLLGGLFAWADLKADKVGRTIAHVYVGLLRGTPPLLMLLLTYYGLPKLLGFIGIQSNDWSKLFFGIAGLSIGWGAYLTEAFRSAYLAVDPGQLRAAYAVGMTGRVAFVRIVLPQAFVIAIPNLQNLVIGLLKATSLVYVIGIADMYQDATELSNTQQGVYQLQIFVCLALIYWGIALVIEWAFRRFLKRTTYIQN